MGKLARILKEAFSGDQRDVIRELFIRLEEEGVIFAVGGGVAVSYWVLGRMVTKGDLDLVMEREDFRRIADILFVEGWRITPGRKEILHGDIVEEYFILEKDGVEVDIILVGDGTFYTEFRHFTRFDGIRVPILRKEWLIVMKWDSGRTKDMDDILMLLKGMDDREKERARRVVGKVVGVDAWEEIEMLEMEGKEGLRFEKRWFEEE